MEDKKQPADRAALNRAPGQHCSGNVLKNVTVEDYDYLANSATGMDCTGLMKRTPSDEAEVESYQRVYRYLPPNLKA